MSKSKSNEIIVIGKMDHTLDNTLESANRVYKTDKISPAITTSFRPSYEIEKYRIRKLTPKECWRLMGFSDEDFEKAAKVNSNTHLYKEAGNSIVKDVLMAIFRQMID